MNPTPAQRLCINLLTRLQNELRAVALLCQNGYALQAFSPTAVIYELGWTIAAVGHSDEESQKWLSHETNNKFENIKELTRRGLLNLAGSEATKQLENQYNWYRELCLAKHINPIAQRNEGFIVEPDPNMMVYTFSPGSAATKSEIKKAWWVMECAARFTHPAMYIYQLHHIGKPQQKNALALIKALESDQEVISNDAMNELKRVGLLAD